MTQGTENIVIEGTVSQNFNIRSMRVLEFPSIRPSRYGREKRKCWSQIALAGMGGKQFFGSPVS